MPTRNPGKRYSPFAFVTEDDSMPVPCCVAVTVTPGSTPPLGSVTRPTMVPVSICAKAEELTVRIVKANRQTKAPRNGITNPRMRGVYAERSVSSVLLRALGTFYLRNESTLHLPDPTAAKYRKTKQYNAASSPPLVIGQKPRGACAWKYATAISPLAMNATGLVNNPIIIIAPPTTSIIPARPICDINSAGPGCPNPPNSLGNP